MSLRKWYKIKRIWGGIFLLVLLGLSRLESLKFRYDKEVLSSNIAKKVQELPTYGSKIIAGKSLHYLRVGNRPDRPLVVFVHGSPGALSAYEVYLTNHDLFEELDMISLDRPGFGYSDFGSCMPSLAEQAALIAAVLEDFPNRKKILVGHSLGGPVIAKLAIEYPQVVDGLLMVAPSISPDLEPSNTWRKIINFPLFRVLTPPALRVCNQEIIPLKEELELMLSGWKEIKVPVTVVQGENDALVPMNNAYFAQTELTNSPAVKIEMINQGDHFILWSETDLIVQEILDLLAKM